MEKIDSSELKAIRSAKTLFKSCKDEDTIEDNGEFKLLKFLNEELGGWPLLNEFYYNPNPNNTLKTLVNLHQVGVYPLFYFYASVNPSDPNYFVLRVSVNLIFEICLIVD